MRAWIVLHGCVRRWKGRQHRHPCGKRRRGRPNVGYGACFGYATSPVRQERRAARLALRVGAMTA